jgi:hypothetical protein
MIGSFSAGITCFDLSPSERRAAAFLSAAALMPAAFFLQRRSPLNDLYSN